MAQIYDPASPTDDNDYSITNESISSQDSNAKKSHIGKISEKKLGSTATSTIVNVHNAQVPSIECIPLPDELPVGIPILNENLKSESLHETMDNKIADNLLVESTIEMVEPATTTMAFDAAAVPDVNTAAVSTEDTAVTSAACIAAVPLQSMSRIQQLIQEKAAKLSTVSSYSANALQTPVFSFGQTKQRKEKVKFSVVKVEKKSKIFDSDSDEEKSSQRVPLSHAKELPPSSCIKPAELSADVIDKVSAVAKRIESRRIKEPAKLASPSSTTSKISSSHFKSGSLDTPITYPIVKKASNEGKIAIEADSTVTEEGASNKTDRYSDIELDASPRSSGTVATSSAAVTTSTTTIKTSSSSTRTGFRNSLSDTRSKQKRRLSSESQVSDRDSAKEDSRKVRNPSKDRRHQRSSSRDQRHSKSRERRQSSSRDSLRDMHDDRSRNRSRGRRRSRSRSYDRSQHDYRSRRDRCRKTYSKSTERNNHSGSYDRKRQRSRSRQRSNDQDHRSSSKDKDFSKILENRLDSPSESPKTGYENHEDASEHSKNSGRALNLLEKPAETIAPPLPVAAPPPEPMFQRTLEERISALENSSIPSDDEGTPPPPPAPEGIVQPSAPSMTFQLSNAYPTDVTQQDFYQQNLKQPLKYMLYNSTSNQPHRVTTYTPQQQSYPYYCNQAVPDVAPTIRYPASQTTQLSPFIAPMRPVVPSLQATIPSILESGSSPSLTIKEKSVSNEELKHYKDSVAIPTKTEEDFSMDISPGNSPWRTSDNVMKPVTSGQSMETMHLSEEQGLSLLPSQLNDMTHTTDAGQPLSECTPKLTNQSGKNSNQSHKGSIVLGSHCSDSDMNTDSKKSKEPHDVQTEKRRSSRIRSKDERVNAEKRIQAHRANAAAEAVKLKPASSVNEETVDFVIDSNTPARLPSRTDIQSSPLSHKASITSPMPSHAPGKLKMRWLKASEHDINEDAISSSDTEGVSSSTKDKLPVNKRTARALNTSESLESGITDTTPISADFSSQSAQRDLITAAPQTSKDPAPFDKVEDNIYLSSSKRVTKKQKEAKRMVCDCSTSAEDQEMQMVACGEDCLNRMLMIECGTRCPCGSFCTNKRFQRHDNAKAEIFLTEKKGHGLKALEPIVKGQFIREYVGEVLGYKEFKHRTKQYAKDNHKHYYFMALNADEIIDATQKGNISRFINHSCDPNCETQKWTVNGILRIGFFAKRDIEEGEEITFDYQFERYGKEAQECYCGSANCRGTLGGARTQPLKQSDKVAVTKKRREDKKKSINEFDDDTLSEEISKLLACSGLGQSAQVIQVCRLMVRAENVEHRKDIISVLLNTHSENCLRLFLSYHGLSLLWSWMVDVGSSCNDLKLMIVKLLRRLPVTTRNAINDTKILSVVQRWAKEMKEKPFKKPSSEIQETVPLHESSLVSSCVPDPTGNVVAGSGDNLETQTIKCVSEADDTTDDATDEKSLSILDSSCLGEHVTEPSEILHAKVIPEDDRTTEKCDVQSQADNSNSQVASDADNASAYPSKKIFLQRVWHESNHQSDDESVIGKAEVDPPIPANVSCDTANADVQKICLLQTEKSSTQSDPSIQSEHHGRTSQTEEQSHSSHSATVLGSEVETFSATAHQSSVPVILLDESSQDSSSLQPIPQDDVQEKVQSASLEDAEVREEMAECLDELLEDWSKLKESFKIPKKQEERKRTMIEIDARDTSTSNADRRDRRESRFDRRSESRFDSRFERESRWDSDRYRPLIRDYRKRRREDSPEYRRSRREDREDEMKPMLTKQQRRERFEARVKAEEESQLQYEQYKSQQQQLVQTLPEPIQLQQFLDPLTGRSFVEPVYPSNPEPGYPVIPEPAPYPVIPESAPYPVIPEPAPYPVIPEPAPYPVITESAPTVQQPTSTIDYHHGQVLVPQTVQYLDSQTQQIYAHTPSAVQQSTVSAPVVSAISASSVQPTQSVSYYTTPQGVLVQQIVQSAPPQPQQIVYMVPEDEPPPPPANPLQSQTPKLPPNWKAAKDAEGRTYFYHRQTRQTQWEMPTGGEEIGAAMELGTPPQDKKPAPASTTSDRKHQVKKSKKKTTTAPADTSSKDSAKKVKENFKSLISVHLRTILNSYMKPDCKVGHITNKEDYKFLAKKLTHAVLDKELKHCRHPEDLEVNENVKFKAKEFVKKYMSRFGTQYKQEKEDSSKN